MIKKIVAVLAATVLLTAGGSQVANATDGQQYGGGYDPCGEGSELLAKYKVDKEWDWRDKTWVYNYVPVFGDEVVSASGDQKNGTFEVLDDSKVVTKVIVKTLHSEHADEYDPGVTQGSFDNGDHYRVIKKVKFCGQDAPKDVEVCRDGEVLTVKEHEQLETDLPVDDPSCQPEEEEEEGEVLGAATTTPPASLPETGSSSAVLVAFISTAAAGVLLASAVARRVFVRV